MPAPTPKNELLLPLSLLELGVVDAPAPIPAKVLLLGQRAPPVIANARLPFRLYCVFALTRFAESVPPAVPLPVMLKFAAVCGLALF